MSRQGEGLSAGASTANTMPQSNTISDTSPVLVEGRRKACVERGVLIVIIVAVIVAIFAPVGVLVEEFLNIESGSGVLGNAVPFNYEESCVIENIVRRIINCS